ncbi:hypothetical protein [Parasitella parasitica]|uniref:Uncharacterized protein n=1 Tax=Parasitella parasitica TaxID=35722 RepID=A0A0B7NUA1_9FUNG|nr:hypothetical protein [Parasitella parasitica]
MGESIKATKRISFSNETGTEEVHILVEQVLDAAYGCYVWPSALVMGEFVWYHRDLFANKTILEVGVICYTVSHQLIDFVIAWQS